MSNQDLTAPVEVTLPDVAMPSTVSWARSLWLRLAVLVAGVTAIILGLFLFVTERVLAGAAMRTGADRALTAATQSALAIGQNSARILLEVQRLSGDDILLRYVRDGSPALAEEIRERLRAPFAGQASAALIDLTGRTILDIRPPGDDLPINHVPPPQGVPQQSGVGPLQESDGVLYTDVVADLRPRAVSSREPPASVGYLVVRRVIQAAAAADMVTRLVGRGAVAAMGNRSGPPWTDFSHMIGPPPVDITGRGSHNYRAPDGGARVGAVAPVDGTPWAVWIDLPQTLVLAPVQTVVRRMLLLAFVAAIAATGTVGWILRRAIKPLNDLTEATESIASGRQVGHIATTRQDEVGRLAAAFNTMSDRVAQMQQDLEARVVRRTARLEKTRSLLETQVTALREAQRELAQFFALSPDLLRITAADGRVVRMNDAWHDVLGWDVDTLLAAPSLSFIHPDDRESTLRAREELRHTGAIRSFENRYRCKDGSYRWLSWRAVANVEAQVTYSTGRDITERKRIERELEQRASQLADLNAELEAFSYSVSHDLRTPLRHIQGFAALLSKSSSARLEATDRRWLDTIDTAALRMSRLIDDLLLLSRTSRAELRKVTVDVAAIVNAARADLAGDPNVARVRWTIDPLPTVEADPSLLRLVFVNLLSNALKYTRLREDAAVAIGTAPGAPFEVVIFVRDNGVGFDMQYAGKLFGVFQRLHSDEQFDGTGVGLANVRRIVQRHGGRVWAEAAPDQGATFYVSLPVATAV